MADSSSSRFHPALAVNNIKKFVPVTLEMQTGQYASWAELFKIHCRAFQVLDHIIPPSATSADKGKAPADSASSAAAQDKVSWSRIDAIVLQWIYGTISNELLNTIIQPDATAQQAWETLQSIFQDNKHSREVYLENQFSQVRQDNFPNISAYCQELKMLADQLAYVDAPVSSQRLVLQLISGLNESYDAIATFIQKSDPLPSFYEASSRLILEETWKSKQAAISNPRAAGLAASTETKEDATPKSQDSDLGSGSQRGQSGSSRGNSGRGNSGRGLSRYAPLYKAAFTGNWEAAEAIFRIDENAKTAVISRIGETALHVAARTRKANSFVKKLVEIMPHDALAQRDSYGLTALHRAAIGGNTKAAKVLVNKKPDLPYISDNDGQLPVHLAAIYCKKKTLKYLISVSKPDEENSLFRRPLGVDLLMATINSEFFDVALDLARNYPDLARKSPDLAWKYLDMDRMGEYVGSFCALSLLAEKETAFRSNESFNLWQTFIYHRIPIKPTELKAAPATQGADSDIESAWGGKSVDQRCSSWFDKVSSIIWNIIQPLVPQGKDMREKKEKHAQALELVKYLCGQMVHLPEAMALFEFSIIVAANNGISEIVVEILHKCPASTFTKDSTGKNILYIAASNRFESIFNLISSERDLKYQFPQNKDDQDNNLMHVCAKLAPSRRLNLVVGAALQMQRELQWFNEMEKFIPSAQKTSFNNEKKTPKMIFSDEHRELKVQGEKWMKDTANACTLAAALIATVVFAAAFTVPGGVASETGIPTFSNEFTFTLFAVSDAISLFTSITSLLMFLSILTSRYAEEDFLHVLPARLGIGLLSLFISIAFMMVAFSATLYLVTREKLAWFITPVTVLACLPVTSFVLLQFPLLLDVLWSTYGPSIFGKKKYVVEKKQVCIKNLFS